MSVAEEVLDSWEEMEASGALDRKLNELQLVSLNDNQTPKLSNGNSNGRMIILGEDGVRSQYVPPKPTVKILKRPPRDAKGAAEMTNGDKPKQPIKSLKQREQEYAEARKRILGEERSPEEKPANEVNKIQSKSTITVVNSPTMSPTLNNIHSPINVVRLPQGPDGTRGFNMRR